MTLTLERMISQPANEAISQVLAEVRREKVKVRNAQWLANALGIVSCTGSFAGWAILVSTYIRLQSVPDAPGPHGLTRNLHTLIGAGYLFLLLQVVAAVLLVFALIPSRVRRKTLLFGLPLAPCAIVLCFLLLQNIAR